MELVRFTRILAPIFPPEFADSIINYLRHPIYRFNASTHPFTTNDKYVVYTEKEHNFYGWDEWERWEKWWAENKVDDCSVGHWLIYESDVFIYINIQMFTGGSDWRDRHVIDEYCIQINEHRINEPKIFKWLYDRGGVSFRLQLRLPHDPDQQVPPSFVVH